MDALDGDDEPLYSKRYQKYRERDIVQFVPYRDFKDGVQLTQEVLAEVPRQLTDYFKSKNIRPNPRRHLNQQELKADQEKKAQEESQNVDFYQLEKEKMANLSSTIGVKKQVALDILNDKGIPEANIKWLKGNTPNTLKQMNDQ